MGSSNTKEVGTEVVEQQNTTNGGFHVFEVQNQGDQNYLWGLKNNLNYYCTYYLSSQIHGQTATFGLVILAVISIVIYIAWRVCRRRWLRERARNMEATFHLQQPPTVRVPIFGRNNDAPPMYPTIPNVASDAPPRYDVEKCMSSLP